MAFDVVSRANAVIKAGNEAYDPEVLGRPPNKDFYIHA